MAIYPSGEERDWLDRCLGFDSRMTQSRRLAVSVFMGWIVTVSGVPRNFVWGGSTNSVEDRGQRERGSGGGSPLVRDSGGSCNLVQKFHFIW